MNAKKSWRKYNSLNSNFTFRGINFDGIKDMEYRFHNDIDCPTMLPSQKIIIKCGTPWLINSYYLTEYRNRGFERIKHKKIDLAIPKEFNNDNEKEVILEEIKKSIAIYPCQKCVVKNNKQYYNSGCLYCSIDKRKLEHFINCFEKTDSINEIKLVSVNDLKNIKISRMLECLLDTIDILEYYVIIGYCRKKKTWDLFFGKQRMNMSQYKPEGTLECAKRKSIEEFGKVLYSTDVDRVYIDAEWDKFCIYVVKL